MLDARQNFTRWLFLGLSLAGALLAAPDPVLAQKVKSVPFSYLPEQGADRYDMRVPRKSLPLVDGSGFVILAHQSSGSYSVERYDADLKKQWSTTIPIAPGETLEAFGRGTQQALVVLHHKDDNGQNLTLVPVSLQGGQKAAPKVLMAVAPREGEPGPAFFRQAAVKQTGDVRVIERSQNLALPSLHSFGVFVHFVIVTEQMQIAMH